jgi:hypothetical protein
MSRSLIRKNQLHPDINDLVGQYGSGYFTSINNLITTGQILQNQINNAVYVNGNQTINGVKNFSNRPTVNGSGVLLQGEATQGESLENLIYTTGDQIIEGVKNFTKNIILQDQVFNISSAGGEIIGNGYTGYHDGGIFLGQTKITQNNTRLVNFASRWKTKGPGVNSLGRLAMSKDGKYITTAVGSDIGVMGLIYISNDYGNTWKTAQYPSVTNWRGLSISNDGKYQFAIADNLLITSSNYGETWDVLFVINQQWRSIAFSDDLKYVTMVANNGQIWTSSNYEDPLGWENRESSRQWRSVSMSSDGKYQSAVAFNDKIYISSDYGKTWTGKESIRLWTSIAVSSNGQYQIASANGDSLYRSNDYGTTWQEISDTCCVGWSDVSMSNDGKYQVASESSVLGSIWFSINYGSTWANRPNAFQNWSYISISSDGKYIVALNSTSSNISVSVADDYIEGNLIVSDNVSGNNLVYNVGNQNISGLKNFTTRPTLSGINLITTGDLVGLELNITPATFVAPNSSEAPLNPQIGQIFFDTVNNNFSGYNGTAWTKLNN